MTVPDYDDTVLIPLDSDQLVLDRVTELIGEAHRRQLWFLLLDEHRIQLPVLLPCDIPRRPEPDALPGFCAFLGAVVDSTDAASIVMVLERRGSATVDVDDRDWCRFLTDAADLAGVPVIGPVLSHSAGVRWIAPDDLIV